MTGLRLLLLIETLAFAAVSMVHHGIGIQGDEHATAGTAEAIMSAVLFGALVASLPRRWARMAAIVGQGFALLGTLVGLGSIALGFGPRTVADVAFDVLIIVVLVIGLMVASRAEPARVEPARVEPARVEPARVEPSDEPGTASEEGPART